MNYMAIVSILIMLAVSILMFFFKNKMTAIALAGAIICCALGMYDFAEIFSELGGTTVALMIGLSILGAAMYISGLSEVIADFILKYFGNSRNQILLGIVLVSGLLSAVSSNTAVVLMMIPMVRGISQKANLSLKYTMYPLGIGAWVGGNLTVIGGTSNVAGNTVLTTHNLTPLAFGEMAWVGLPVMIVSILFLLVYGKKMAPETEGFKLYNDSINKTVVVKKDKKKLIITSVLVVLSIAAMIISSSALFVCALVGAVLLILTDCVSEKEAFYFVDTKLYILIVCFSVIAASVENSGGAEMIANAFVTVFGSNVSPYLVCAALFIATSLFSHFMSNVVAVMLFAPIGIYIAEGLGLNAVALVVTTIFGANCCCATPVGSSFFTMLMPEADYSFKDYVKMGLPYVVINAVLAIAIIPMIWKF